MGKKRLHIELEEVHTNRVPEFLPGTVAPGAGGMDIPVSNDVSLTSPGNLRSNDDIVGLNGGGYSLGCMPHIPGVTSIQNPSLGDIFGGILSHPGNNTIVANGSGGGAIGFIGSGGNPGVTAAGVFVGMASSCISCHGPF
jgi:hypothetical protein